MGWLKKLTGFENSFSKDFIKDIGDDPSRLFTGIDPASTKLWNGVTGSDNQALVNQLGSPGQQYYDQAEARGIDTGPARGFHKAADVVAGIFGAKGLAGIGGGLGGGAAGGAGGVGAGGAAGAGAGAASLGGAAGAAGGAGMAGAAGAASSSLWGPIIGAGASLASGYFAKDAAKDAAAAQQQSAQLGIDETRRQFDAVQKLLAPYVGGGVNGIRGQQDLLGINGMPAQQSAISGIQNSPFFSAMAQQGEDAILQNASATGGLRGGNTQGALAQFRPALLNSLIDQQYSRLGGLTQIGQASAAGQAAAGMQTGNSIAGLLGQQGAAQAGSALAGGVANNQMIGGITNALGSFVGGGGSFGGLFGGGAATPPPRQELF
jgi:hypothetical protein